MILLPAEEEEAMLSTRPDKVRPGDGERALLELRAVGSLPTRALSVPSGGPWSGETQSWPHRLSSGYK